MKKLFVLILAVAMAFAGTAMAQNTVDFSNIQNDPGATMRVWYPGTYSTVDTGASAYYVTNQGWIPGDWTWGGTTVWGVSNTDTNGAGTEMKAVMMTDVAVNFLGGVTPIGSPQLLSGTTSHMILYVLADRGVANVAGTAGASIYRVDGGLGGGVVQVVVIPFTGLGTPGGACCGALADTLAGNTALQMAIPTIEWEEAHSAASVYGISGASNLNVALGGVSIWRRNSDYLGVAPSDTGANAGTTAFPGASGVSNVWASPVIAGNSVFVVAYHQVAGAANAGISIFQLDKRNFSLDAVGADASACGIGLNSANVIEPGGDRTGIIANNLPQITPTPAVQVDRSGGTIYVVDWTGGVSLYDAQDLSMNRGDYQQYNFVKDFQGVTASPVATADKLFIAWSSSVSCFETLNATGSGVSPIWGYDFDEAVASVNNRHQIWATPVISNGYVWVTVLDTNSNDNTIYRFTLNNQKNGAPVIVSTEPLTYGGPIVVGDNREDDDDENGNIWYCSYNPTVDRIQQYAWASAHPYWTQFKFDAAKTGENTWIEDDDDYPGDSSGCFISTLK
jgi:hypothetical protein